MKCLAILAITPALLVSGCDNGPVPLRLDKFCVTESGMSNYWLSTSAEKDRSRPTAQTGWLRYQFMGQDIRYAVNGAEREGRKITFRAKFHDSLTGETNASPFIFVYDTAADTLKLGDVDPLKIGSNLAHCQNIQGAGAPVALIDHVPDATGFEEALAASKRAARDKLNDSGAASQ